jgi:pilus assembly protein Flp/PilA
MITLLLKLAAFRPEAGQDLVEYALLVAMIAFGAVAAIGSLSTQINLAFDLISSDLASSL